MSDTMKFPTEGNVDFPESIRKMRAVAEEAGMSLQEYILYWLYVEMVSRPQPVQITFERDDESDPFEPVEEGA